MGLRGLYVHIPFCAVKCFYCDFSAFSGQRAQIDRYLDALDKEAEMSLSRLRRASAPHPALACADSASRAGARADFDTVYIGGGTPSELSASGIVRLFGMLDRRFDAASRSRETTFEANPDSLDADKIDALRACGATRLSLGLQTADDGLLRSIGRRHDWATFRRVFDACREAGLAVNVDLMYGLPGQSLASLESSLEAVLALKPEHLSLYGLQVEDRTVFGRREVEVDEDLARLMFESALDRLAVAGFRHYEISNFARPGFESIHNRIYWTNGEYLGLGCGASSFLNGSRRSNLDRLEPYCAAVERGDPPTAEDEALEGRRALGETALLGLRLLEGLPWTAELAAAFPEERRHVVAQGWATLEDGRLRLTREGVFLANKVFAEFVEPFRSDVISLPDGAVDYAAVDSGSGEPRPEGPAPRSIGKLADLEAVS